MADNDTAKQKGRADAAKGSFNPPGYGLFDSHETVQKKLEVRHACEEGFHDKRDEMKKGK